MARISEVFRPPIPPGWRIYAPRLFVQGLHLEEHRKQAAAFVKGSAQTLDLMPEPTNAHDPNAVRVIGQYKGWFSTGHAFLGYVSRDIAEALVKTGLLGKVEARLKYATVAEGGGDVEFEIVGPKEHKVTFDSFFAQQLNDGPISDEQKDFAWFFGFKLPKGSDYGQAQAAIDARTAEASPEGLAAWNAYWSICEELDDPDNRRDSYFVKSISRKILRLAIDDLKNAGRTMVELGDDPQLVVDRILELHPELERNDP